MKILPDKSNGYRALQFFFLVWITIIITILLFIAIICIIYIQFENMIFYFRAYKLIFTELSIVLLFFFVEKTSIHN